jgi:hypothetical protein
MAHKLGDRTLRQVVVVQSTYPIQEHPEEMRSFVWVTVTGCNFSEKAFVTGHPSPFPGVSALEAA